jgi:copper chaperone
MNIIWRYFMRRESLDVEGMSCDHCVKTIKNEVGRLKGVNKVDVDLRRKTVTVEYDDSRVSTRDIERTIDREGYKVK